MTNAKELIKHLLQNGKGTLSWYGLAVKFDIKPEGTAEQRKKAANDIWRNYLKTVSRNTHHAIDSPNTIAMQSEKDFEVYKDLENDTIKISGASDVEITDLDGFLKAGNVDVSKYEVARFWQMFKSGKWKFSVFLKPRSASSITPEEFENIIKKHIYDYEVPQLKRSNKDNSGNFAVLNLFDAHIDLITVVDETNKDSTVESNVIRFEKAFDELLNSVLIYSPELIIFPIGSDFFNTEFCKNTTARGTPQDVNYGWQDHFITGVNLYRRCIDKIQQVCPVHIVSILGNHGYDKEWMLGKMIEIVYENNKRVTIDTSRKARKYYHSGKVLLGFGHGDREKTYIRDIPMTMFLENKSVMADIEFSDFFCGDLHHKFENQFQRSKDLKGCYVRFLRAITDSSRWEFNQGYIGVPKTAEAYVYNKEDGLRNNLHINI